MGCGVSSENDRFQTKSESYVGTSPMNSQRIIARARKLGRKATMNSNTNPQQLQKAQAQALKRRPLSQSGLLFSFKRNRIESEHELVHRGHHPDTASTSALSNHPANLIISAKTDEGHVVPFSNSNCTTPSCRQSRISKASGDSERFFGMMSPSNMLNRITSLRRDHGSYSSFHRDHSDEAMKQDSGLLRRQSTSGDFFRSLDRIKSSSINDLTINDSSTSATATRTISGNLAR
jgi:hypothetical protein